MTYYTEFDALPRGEFNVIVADPPWMYQKRPGMNGGGEGAPGIAERVYPTMTNQEVARLDVGSLAAPDAHLFLWVTNPGMFGGRFSDVTPQQIAASWGFEFKTILTWVKTTQAGEPTGGGMGWFFRGATEHVLYATRGRASIAAARREKNVVMAPRRKHSQKPDEFMELVERVTDGSRLELFSRSLRPGWSAWGNEPTPAEAVAS